MESASTCIVALPTGFTVVKISVRVYVCVCVVHAWIVRYILVYLRVYTWQVSDWIEQCKGLQLVYLDIFNCVIVIHCVSMSTVRSWTSVVMVRRKSLDNLPWTSSSRLIRNW